MHVHGRLSRVTACLCNMTNITQDMFKGTTQRAPHMRVISVYNGPIRLLADHDFTVRCIQVESIARGTFNGHIIIRLRGLEL